MLTPVRDPPMLNGQLSAPPVVGVPDLWSADGLGTTEKREDCMDTSRAPIAVGLALVSSAMFTGAQNTSIGQEKSWTTVRETVAQGENPSRTTDTYRQSGSTSFHQERVDVLAPGGGYELYRDTETETVHDNTSTIKTVRKYSRGIDGQRQLAEVTEERRQNTPGKETTIRTTSTPDEYRKQQPTHREVSETIRNGSESQTHSTVFSTDATGTLAAVTHVVEARDTGRGTLARTVQQRDLAGEWQVAEEVSATRQTNAQNQTVTMEITSRPDFEGNLSEVSRSVLKQSRVEGEQFTTAERYSLDVPGSARDGRLHFVERTTTAKKNISGQKTIVSRLAEPDLGHPNERDLTTTTVTVHSLASGFETKTTLVRNLDGSVSVFSHEETKPNGSSMQILMSPVDRLK